MIVPSTAHSHASARVLLHWSRPGGPLGHTLIPRVILAKCRRAVAGIVKHRELLAPGIEVGNTVVIDSAERDPGTGQVIACTFNGRDHLRIYHRMGNGRVVLRLAPHLRDEHIAVRKADTLVIHDP